MTDGEALHQRILFDPTDNDVRLIYADWLDENGHPEKAEFIRVQCELATFDSSYYLSYHNRSICENSAVPLVKRSAELLHPAWSKDLCQLMESAGEGIIVGSMNQWEFRRGFFHRIEIPVLEFMRLAKVIFRHHPIQHVKLTDFGFGFPLDRWRVRVNNTPRVQHCGSLGVTYLPVAFKTLLELGCERPEYGNREYDTEELAHEDISQACVAFGRQLVGLDQPKFETVDV